MIKVELSINTRRPRQYSIPQSWWEVPTRRVVPVLRLLNQPTLSSQVAEMRILRNLTGMQLSLMQAIRPSDLVAMCTHLSWLYQSAGPDPLQPDFAHHGTIYYLPKAKAENLTCLEFALCEDYYEAAIDPEASPSNAARNMLLLTATLCREAQPDKAAARAAGDIRVPLLAREEVDARADRLQYLPPEYVHLALLYWIGNKEYIAKLYGQWLFDKPVDDEESDADEPQKSKGPLFGWWGVYMDVAEKGIFGTLDAVHLTNLHTLCMYLVKQVEATRDAERRMEMQKSYSSTKYES